MRRFTVHFDPVQHDLGVGTAMPAEYPPQSFSGWVVPAEDFDRLYEAAERVLEEDFPTDLTPNPAYWDARHELQAALVTPPLTNKEA